MITKSFYYILILLLISISLCNRSHRSPYLAPKSGLKYCIKGYYCPPQSRDINFSCLRCPAGFTSDGMSTCIPCEAGEALVDTYTNLGFKCEVCPKNTYTENGIDCEQCNGGYYSEAGSISCIPCDIGKYRRRGLKDTKCIDCPSGKTTNRVGSITLNECNQEKVKVS